MKALRSFCTNKQLLLLNPRKTLRNSLNLFSRQFHTTPQRSWAQGSGLFVESSRSQSQPFSSHSEGGGNGQDSRNAGPAWSIYNPITGKIAAQRGVKECDKQELEPGISSSRYEGLEEFGGETSYGNVNKGNLSSYVEQIGEVAEEKVSGDVKEGALWRVDGNQVEGSCNGDGEERLSKGKNYEGGDKNSFGTYREGKQVFSNEKRFANVKMGVNSVNVVGLKDVLGNRKKGKNKISYVCESCGYTDGQWWGYCRECKAAGSMKQFSEAGSESGGKVSGIEVSEHVVRSWLPQQAGELRPLRLTDVNRGINQLKWRIPLSGTFGCEVDRVLGGGLVPGSLVLIGGDPGVGKSTLLLQIAAIIADGQSLGETAPVVYVSGEESVEQIGNRADRMNIGTENLFLYSSTDIEDILEKIQPLSPRALVVDSIQTVYLKGVIGSAGNIAQVKECTSALLRFAKKTNISVLLIGHVTKAGEIAGPRVLEHIVDVVLYMEGEKYSSHRLLRPVKNRFGSTDELGVFEMAQSGLQAVSNPSEIFLSEQLSDSEVLAGLAVAVVMDGSRSFLIEVQALCVSGSSVARHVNGIQASKADMIISVLIKQAGLMLQQNAIFLNVVSGVTLTETAGDLAIAAAICSSFLEFPIPNNVAFIGEIGLGGELRSVPRMEKRLNTVAKLGYERCVVPKSTEKSLANLDLGRMEVIGCKNLKEMINTVFRAQQ